MRACVCVVLTFITNVPISCSVSFMSVLLDSSDEGRFPHARTIAHKRAAKSFPHTGGVSCIIQPTPCAARRTRHGRFVLGSKNGLILVGTNPIFAPTWHLRHPNDVKYGKMPKAGNIQLMTPPPSFFPIARLAPIRFHACLDHFIFFLVRSILSFELRKRGPPPRLPPLFPAGTRRPSLTRRCLRMTRPPPLLPPLPPPPVAKVAADGPWLAACRPSRGWWR